MSNPLSQKQVNLQLGLQIPDVTWKASVPILAIFGRRLQQFGTGTLVSIADQSFLVTAAHVVKDALKAGGSLCLAGASGSFVQIHGDFFCSNEGQYSTSRDPFDVSILPLDSNTVQKLGKFVYLRLDDIDFNEDQTTGIFCLCGFPVLWSHASTDAEPTMSSKPLQYVTYAFAGSTTSLQEYQDRFHILLNADPNEITDKEGKMIIFKGLAGTPANFPKDLGAISGCCVWKIGDTRVPFAKWGTLQPKVVGVQTGIYSNKKKIIKATRWVAVSTLLTEAFPKLKPAILLHS